MTELTGNDAILRFRANESRFNDFINNPSGYYTASDGRQVPVLAEWTRRLLVPIKVITTTYQASPGEILLIDSVTAGGAVSISMLAAPTDSQAFITLIDYKGTWATNNVSFDPGAVPIAVPGAVDATGITWSENYSVAVIGYVDSKYRMM